MSLVVGNRICVEPRPVEGAPGLRGSGSGTHWNHFGGDAALSFEWELELSWLGCLFVAEVFSKGHVG